MTNFIGPYTTAAGQTVRIDADSILAIEAVPVAGTFQSAVWTIGASPMLLLSDLPATLLADLATAGKTTTTLPMANGNALAVVVGAELSSSVVLAVDADTTALYDIDSAPIIIEDDIAAVVAALTPAPLVGAPLLLGYAVLNAAGVVQATRFQDGIDVTLTANAYVPGTGVYSLAVGGADAPAVFIGSAQLIVPPPGGAAACQQVGANLVTTWTTYAGAAYEPVAFTVFLYRG